MQERCKPGRRQCADYAERGISVCAEWRGRGGFLRFYKCVGARPSKGHSIERIKNERGYEPGNVRWATWTEQMSNTRRNRMVTLAGETLTLTAWARKLGISAPGLAYRIHAGWAEDRILK